MTSLWRHLWPNYDTLDFKILTQCVKMLGERVLQVWRWYLQRFRRYRKKTRGGARNSPPPVGRGLKWLLFQKLSWRIVIPAYKYVLSSILLSLELTAVNNMHRMVRIWRTVNTEDDLYSISSSRKRHLALSLFPNMFKMNYFSSIWTTSRDDDWRGGFRTSLAGVAGHRGEGYPLVRSTWIRDQCVKAV